jgi:hypothetical protein
LTLIRTRILNDLADDYESLEHITSAVVKAGLACGLEIDAAVVGGALAGLIASGLVKAYRLSPSPVEEVPSSVATANLRDYYFWQTPKGREVHRNADWPFDEEGHLLSAIEDGA